MTIRVARPPHARTFSARSIDLCVIWICINLISSSENKNIQSSTVLAFVGLLGDCILKIHSPKFPLVAGACVHDSI